FFEGRSLREIGVRVGLSEDGAQKRVARGLDRIRLFLQRHGVTTSAAALTGLLGVNLTGAAETQLLQSTLASVKAALAGNTTIRSLTVANRIGRWLAWRQAGLVALPTAVGLLVIGGGGWLLQDNLTPALPPSPAFQLSDARVANVAHAWSRVVQQAAQLIRQSPPRPLAGDPRVAAYQREVDFIVAETVRLSKELDAIVQQGNDRTLLAEFLTVELTDTLDLGAGQKAAVYALLLQQLREGPSLLEGMQALVRAKAADAVTIRSWLSARQKRRFDRTYRADGLGLFTFAAAAAASATTK